MERMSAGYAENAREMVPEEEVMQRHPKPESELEQKLVNIEGP